MPTSDGSTLATAAAKPADTQATVAQNAEWFDDNDLYIATQSKLDHYRYCKLSVEHEIKGIDRLLDIGNGGFFNYDTGLVGHATAVDLFLKDGPGPGANTTFKSGSILDMPFADKAFDGILLQNVFHHVTGKTVASNFANLRQSMRELYRCLEPGGKVLIVESTVGYPFYLFERAVYGLLLKVKKGGHPVTFQFTADQILAEAAAAGFEVAEYMFVPCGRWLLQFGRRWPAALSPARPIKLVLTRK